MSVYYAAPNEFGYTLCLHGEIDARTCVLCDSCGVCLVLR